MKTFQNQFRYTRSEINSKKMENHCPKYQKCPLFNDNLLVRQSSADAYKNLYCRAGMDRWAECKRYQTSEALGQCPDFVMPNSTATVEEIELRMKKKKLI